MSHANEPCAMKHEPRTKNQGIRWYQSIRQLDFRAGMAWGGGGNAKAKSPGKIEKLEIGQKEGKL